MPADIDVFRYFDSQKFPGCAIFMLSLLTIWLHLTGPRGDLMMPEKRKASKIPNKFQPYLIELAAVTFKRNIIYGFDSDCVVQNYEGWVLAVGEAAYQYSKPLSCENPLNWLPVRVDYFLTA